MLARQQVIDQKEALLETIAHGNRHSPVKLDNWGWLNLKQTIVE
jgi:hypothetical protein